jgi:hypothetical protein
MHADCDGLTNKSTLVDGSRRANVVGGGCVLLRAVLLAGYPPSELSKRSGERRRDRKSTRAAAPCATSGSAANVRPTGSSSTLVAPLDLGIAARCVALMTSSPARPRRVRRVPKLRPASSACAAPMLDPSLALTTHIRSIVLCAGSSKAVSYSAAMNRARARGSTLR